MTTYAKPAAKPAQKRMAVTEQVYSVPSRIDKTNGILHGVKVLGRVSRNGREYTPQALQEAARHYGSVKVNLSHPDRSTPRVARRFEDQIGWLEQVQVRDDGVYANLHLIKSHPYSGVVLEMAERRPNSFGLSHNADCLGTPPVKGGKLVVEGVPEVRSVDIVQSPATTAGIFEQEEIGMARWNRIKGILEMDGMPTPNGGLQSRDGTVTPTEPTTNQGAAGAPNAADVEQAKQDITDAVNDIDKFKSLLNEILSDDTITTTADLYNAINGLCDAVREAATGAWDQSGGDATDGSMGTGATPAAEEEDYPANVNEFVRRLRRPDIPDIPGQNRQQRPCATKPLRSPALEQFNANGEQNRGPTNVTEFVNGLRRGMGGQYGNMLAGRTLADCVKRSY